MVRRGVSDLKKRFVFVWAVPLLLLGMCQTYVFGGSAPVERTGQITSYSATGGEDGDLKKGVVWPKPRFKDNGNGTVTDKLTKLIWLKNANAFGLRTWEQALSDANALSSGSAGLSDGSKAGDWRLPNLKELQSLFDYAYTFPALSNASGTLQWTSGDAFTGVLSDSNFYWSSTTDLYGTEYAWVVRIALGNAGAGHKLSGCYVWPVRTAK